MNIFFQLPNQFDDDVLDCKTIIIIVSRRTFTAIVCKQFKIGGKMVI